MVIGAPGRVPAPGVQRDWTVLVSSPHAAPPQSAPSPDVFVATQTTSGDLTDFLRWGITHYPAKNYLVIVDSDHSSPAPLRKAFETVRPELGASPVVLALDGGLNQTVELGYELRDSVAIVSASPEPTEAGSFPYQTILEHLETYHDRHTPHTVGDLIVEAHRARSPYTTFTAVDTNRLRDVAPAFKLLVKAIEEEQVPRDQLYTALLESASLQPGESLKPGFDLRDLVGFSRRVEVRCASPRVKLAARQLGHAVREAVVDHAVHPHRKSLIDTNGPAVYLPWRDPGSAARGDHEELEFARDSGWSRLLDYLYQGEELAVPTAPTATAPLGAGQRLAKTALYTYKKYVSPYLGIACPHTPSCSQYAREAVEEHGVVEGVQRGFMRLVSCNGHTHEAAGPTPPEPSITIAPPTGSPKSELRRQAEGVLFTVSRWSGKLLGGLTGAVVGGAAGLAMGAVLGWNAGGGRLEQFYQGVAEKYGAEQQAGFERLASPLTVPGHALHRPLGPLLGGVAGAVTGALLGGLGGAWKTAVWTSRLGGLAAQNLAKDACGELPVHVATEAILRHDYADVTG